MKGTEKTSRKKTEQEPLEKGALVDGTNVPMEALESGENPSEKAPQTEAVSNAKKPTHESKWARGWRYFCDFWKAKSTKEMLLYILKRLVLLALTFIVIFVMLFVLVRLLPINADTGMTDPAVFYEKMVAQGRYVKNSDGTYSAMPILQQFWNFLKNLFTSDHPFGYSFYIQWLESPSEILASRLPPTILLNIYTMVIAVPVGILLGMFMALRKNHIEDHVLSVLIMLFISVPSYVYAFLLQYLFGYVWQVLPATAASSSVGYGSWTYFQSIILPILSMCFGSIAGYARYTRAELTEVLTSDFMLLARTKGLTRGQATIRHAFRNSLVPIFPMLLGEIISLLSGSMIIESIFAVNGVGGLYLNSILKRDYDVFQFVSMFYILIGLVGGLIVDVSYGFVDPRIRMGSKK